MKSLKKGNKKKPMSTPTPPPPPQQVTDAAPKTNPDEGINPTETKAQAEVNAETAAVPESEATPDSTGALYEGEFGTHHIKVYPQRGLNYNFYSECTCGHQARTKLENDAIETAQRHIDYWKSKKIP